MRNFLFLLLLIPVCVVAQYGILDDSFGNNGIAIHEENLPADVNAHWSLAMATDPNGNIYTGTNYNYNQDLTAYNDNILISKFNAQGSADPSFGVNGYKKINVANGQIYVYEMLVSGDNYIYLIGGIFLNSTNERKMMVIKMDVNGNFDSNFGNAGMFLFSAEKGTSGARIIETSPNEFLIGGNYYRNDNSLPGLLLLKIDANANIITSFGNSGILKYSHSDFDVLRDLKLYDDGGFQVLDYSSDNLSDFNYVFLKFNPNGSLDASFNQTGFKVIPIASDNLYDFGSIELKSNENIIYSSNGFDGNFYSMNLTEFMPDGNLNVNFGTNGSVTTYFNNIFAGSYLHLQRTFVLTPDDNHIIQIGYVFENQMPLSKMALVAFGETGNLDHQFGINGVAMDKIHPSLNDEPTKAVFVDNDRVLVLNGTHLSLARYTIYEGLSVEEISQNAQIRIAPNPASNSFIINGLNGIRNQIQIFDLSGKLIQEFHAVQNNQTLNLGSISKGTYLVKIQSGKSTETKKLMLK